MICRDSDLDRSEAQKHCSASAVLIIIIDFIYNGVIILLNKFNNLFFFRDASQLSEIIYWGTDSEYALILFMITPSFHHNNIIQII